MVPWTSWCRFCGTAPLEENPFTDLKEDPGLFDVAVQYFSLSVHQDDPICPSCRSNLQIISDFTKSYETTQKMFEQFLLEPNEDIEAAQSGMIKTENVLDEAAQSDSQLRPKMEIDENLGTNIPDVLEDNEQSSVEGDVEEEEEVEQDEVVKYVEIIPKPVRLRGSNVEKSSPPKKVQKCTIKCKYCDKRFKSDWYRRAHERSHVDEAASDGNNLPYSCEECGKRFRTLTGLKSHIVVHSDYAPFTCDICGRSFKNVTRLRTHKEMHDTTKNICPICGMQLNTRHSFHKHKRVHSDQKAYTCPVCPKAFKKNTALKEHLIGHTQLRPYSCPFCEKTFTNGASCRHHKVKYHPNELAVLEASGDMEEVLARHRNLPTLEELIATVRRESQAESRK